MALWQVDQIVVGQMIMMKSIKFTIMFADLHLSPNLRKDGILSARQWRTERKDLTSERKEKYQIQIFYRYTENQKTQEWNYDF